MQAARGVAASRHPFYAQHESAWWVIHSERWVGFLLRGAVLGLGGELHTIVPLAVM